MEITRRNLFKLGSIMGLGAVLPSCAKEQVLKPKEQKLPSFSRETYVNSVCGLCPAGCGIRIRKIGDKAVGIAGIPEHPINKGGLCPKGAALLQDLYHPDRLQKPLLRHGPRGSGEWEEISWEKAISTIANNIAKAKTLGIEKRSLALTSSHAWDIHRELLHQLAQTLGNNNFFTYRYPFSSDKAIPTNLSSANLFVSFGLDWLSSYPSPVEAQMLYAELRRGMRMRRAHIVQIESRFSVTAAKADQWIPIKPGTEGFLALGLCRRLVTNGAYAYDEAFLQEHTNNFREFVKNIDSLSLEDISGITGIAIKDIHSLADKFMSFQPAIAIGNAAAKPAIDGLNVILGNFNNIEESESPFPAHENNLRTELLLVDRVNPLFTSPKTWKSILEKIPFIVTVSSYVTETATFSDIVLPCHTSLEQTHCSIHKTSNGKIILNVASPAVTPLYDSKEPGEIFTMISQATAKTASDGDLNSHSRSWVKKFGAEKILEDEQGKKWTEISALQSSHFFIASGKINFPAMEIGINDNGNYPLFLYVYTPLAFSYGEGSHLPYLQSVAGPQTQEAWATWAEIHPDTAQKYGIKDGKSFWIESTNGKIEAKARLTSSAMPDVVSVPMGLGHSAYGRWAKDIGANPMELVEDMKTTRIRIYSGRLQTLDDRL